MKILVALKDLWITNSSSSDSSSSAVLLVLIHLEPRCAQKLTDDNVASEQQRRWWGRGRGRGRGWGRQGTLKSINSSHAAVLFFRLGYRGTGFASLITFLLLWSSYLNSCAVGWHFLEASEESKMN